MPSNPMRIGITLTVLFAVAYGAYAWINPATGPTTDAGALGLNISRPGNTVASTAGGTPDGFKGTDEELEVVPKDR